MKGIVWIQKKKVDYMFSIFGVHTAFVFGHIDKYQYIYIYIHNSLFEFKPNIWIILVNLTDYNT